MPHYDWKSFKIQDPNSWPFIPVPEVATDPNGGVTYGVLPVWLFTDNKNEISSILAPDINANSTLGPGGNFRYLAYPSTDTNWYAVAGAQETIARKVDLDYQTGRDHKNWWSFEGRFYFERDPTERFFGLSNHSHEGNQSNYTTEQLYGEAIFGLNFSDKLQLSMMETAALRANPGGRLHFGAVNLHRVPASEGTQRRQRSSVAVDAPIRLARLGGYPAIGPARAALLGIADRRFGSSHSYNRFGGEFREFYTIGKRITFAGHVFNEYEPAGNEMPFWSQARLGGDESLLTDQETLRGYGTGRFIDNNLFVMNVEMRTRVWDKNIFGTHGILELAPFAEAGRVAHDMGYNPFTESAPGRRHRISRNRGTVRRRLRRHRMGWRRRRRLLRHQLSILIARRSLCPST